LGFVLQAIPGDANKRLFLRKAAAQCRRDWLGEYLVGARLECDRLIARVDTTRAVIL